MHEWGIAVNIMQKVEEAVKNNGMKKVLKVDINLGEGLGISREEFEFCLKTISKDEVEFKDCVFDIKMTDAKLASIEGIDAE